MTQAFHYGVYSERFADAVCGLAYQAFLRESRYGPCMQVVTEQAFRQDMERELALSSGWVALDEAGGLAAWLLCQRRGTEDNRCYIGRLWGCGRRDEGADRAVPQLFRRLAEEITGGARFEITLYAHDLALLRIFSLLQFGIQCERDIGRPPEGDADGVRLLGRDELCRRWPEVWALLDRLIDHLKQSPVFYPGAEFTQAAYRAFLLDKETNVFAAEREGALIGLIETNPGAEDVLTRHAPCANVGEVFVEQTHRGQGIARRLLNAAAAFERARGNELMWVEHGTANPEAMAFWDRYFEPYAYTLLRAVAKVKD